jgi:hypothetical protein
MLQGTDQARYAPFVGARVGNLIFSGLTGERDKNTRFIGLFACDCGQEIRYPASRVLVSGCKTHCGCRASANRATNLQHGGRYSAEYSSWIAMRRRCLNPRDKDFPKWGGRGIAVYLEWVRSFGAFLAYMGPRPAGTSIDRIDPDKGYEPGNVRWATSHVQARNRKNLTTVDTPLGRMALVDYAKASGITNACAHWRLKRGKLTGVAHVR